MKIIYAALVLLPLAACQTTTEPIVDYASSNVVSYRYHGFGLAPTLPAKVRDMAAQHCEKFGKNAVYKGGKPANMISTEEIHDFTCEQQKVKAVN